MRPCRLRIWRPGLAALLAALCAFPLAGARGAGPQSDADLRYQATYVWQGKRPMGAAYTGPNSLVPDRERSYSFTGTVFAGWRLAPATELYFNPELALGLPLSGLTGLGGFTNGEMARTTGRNPNLYRSRLFLRQTWGMGGDREELEGEANQLAGSVDARRIVLTAGNFSALDVFDDNAYSHEPRRQFMNWSLMTHGAWDYPADSRGYTWGAALEYISPDWAARAGRFLQPKVSNGLPLNTDWRSSYGDVAELELPYAIAGHGGRARLLAFRNVAVMGGFDDAVAAGARLAQTPDLAGVRRRQAKRGWGINLEQSLARDTGAFMRASRGDGRTETYAFTEIDRSLSAGLSFNGRRWQRAADEAGIALVRNGLSADHRRYLQAGGLGFFLGDGRLNYRPERTLEAWYSFKFTAPLWLTLDYQRVANPGYNADRGPAQVLSLRLHTEF